MTVSNYITLGLAGFGLVFIAFVGKRAGWFKIIGGTNALLREQNQELRNSNDLKDKQITTLVAQHEADKKEFAAKHLDNQKAISKLEGQVDILSTLQLSKMASTLSEMKDLLALYFKNAPVTADE